MKLPLPSIAVAIASLAAGGSAAPAPSLLSGVAGGLWEVSGLPGSKAPVRQCLPDPFQIAFAGHPNAGCKHQPLSNSGDILRVSYNCPGSGFGQAVIKTLTPRSLRVEVQGIADGAPYAYVMQAHRVGDCAGKSEYGH